MLKDAAREARAWGERLSRGPLVAKLTMLVVLVGVIRIALRPAHVQHDVAMYLEAGQLLLRGQRPYVDFIDVNPPLITYLSAIPAAVAALLRTSVVPTALLMTACVAAASLAATRRALVAAFAETGADALMAEVAILALACAFFLSDVPELLDVPFPGNALSDPRLSAIFGQREHLMMIGAAPFVAVRFWRWEGGRPSVRSAVLAGAVASVVTCLKPQFVGLLLAMEIGWFAARRTLAPFRAPELGAFCVVGVAYAVHFALLPDAIRAAWFGRWLPFVIKGYGVFNEPSYADLAARCLPALIALVAAFGVTLAVDAAGQRLLRGFALMAGAGVVLYVMQKKGWTYHAFPERTCAAVVAACFVAALRPLGWAGEEPRARVILPFSRRHAERALAGLVGCASVVCAVCLLRIDTPGDVDRLRRRSQIMRTIDSLTKEGDAVLVATTSVWDPYPALTLQNRMPGSRYLWLFPIPMLQAETAGGDAERAFVQELSEDIRSRRPTLLLLQTGRCFGCKKASVESFFREHPPLSSALDAYSLRGTVRDGQELQVFVRSR